MRVVSVGECMIEFFRRDDGSWVQGFAGDTLNVAWALRALMPADVAVDYQSAVGSDGFSDAMLEFLARAGIGTAAMRRDPNRRPGLYTIQTDPDGERHFDYWRGQSAARHLADDRDALASGLQGADLVYVSGITLAILPPAGRANLLAALGPRGSRSFRLAFDPNVRPRLWTNQTEMCAALTDLATLCDIALPTHDDEALAFGDADAAATRARYQALGVPEVIVKDGTRATLFALDGETGECPVPRPVQAVDTTGAGDSFGGGYLAARLSGKTVSQAIAQAQAVAAAVVGQRGALIPPADIRAAAGIPG